MFVDFDKTFNSKPQTDAELPDAFVSYLSQGLPKGLKYISNGSEVCIAISEGDSMNIGGFIYEPTAEVKAVLGDTFTQADVAAYYYNMQQPIPVRLKEEGHILLNGELFPIDQMAYNPYHPIKYVSGSFRVFPHPFPPPFTLKIGNNKYERELTMSRVPHPSVNIVAYESKGDEALCLKCYLNETTGKMSLNLTFNLTRARKIRDIVESTAIYNSYLDGDAMFAGHKLEVASLDPSAQKFDPNSIMFWEKVLKIEEILEVEFVPPKEDIDYETMYLVEQLYQNLAHQTPIRKNQKIGSVDSEWTTEKETLAQEMKGKGIYFEFEAIVDIELFDVELSLPALVGIFNAIVSGATREGDKYKICLEDESEDKPRYISELCFKSDREMAEYRKRDHNEIIIAFHDAKKASEYQ